MAGEWLKFESNLPEKPETLAITAAMGWDDPDLTVGKLMRLFRWFDQQTVDGNARSVTPALLDRIIGVPGFVTAVASVGWIVIDGGSLSLSNFDRHNGETAKSRAQTAKRVAKHKAKGASNAEGNGEGNADSVSDALPKEEKRREESNTGEKPAAARQAKPLEGEVSPKLLADYLAVRKAKKAGPLTDTAVAGLRREATKAGVSITEAITCCCEAGWQGFNAEWYARRQTTATHTPANRHAGAAAAIFGMDEPRGDFVDV